MSRVKFIRTKAQILAHYGYTELICFRCGTTNTEKCYHREHIRTRGSSPDLINDLDNLIILCAKCHIARGQMPEGWHYDEDYKRFVNYDGRLVKLITLKTKDF